MEPPDRASGDDLEVVPLVVVSQTFPARPSSIPDIRDFVHRWLDQSPLSEEDNAAVSASVSEALLDAAGPDGTIQVSFRIFPDHAEVDVLRSHTGEVDPRAEPLAGWLSAEPGTDRMDGAGLPTGTFSEWMAETLRREGLTMEAAARQLGVSVRTVSRWVGGATEPRMRDLRRIHEVFGEVPFP